jgi:kynurenine formamidase
MSQSDGGAQTFPVGMSAGLIRFSRVVHLSHVLRPDMPIFPGDPPWTSTTWSSIAEHGYHVEHLSHGTHAGTHVSVPAHFLADGATLDRMPAHMFVHSAVMIDVRERVRLDPDFQLTWADMESFEQEHALRIPVGACVILFTGFQDRFVPTTDVSAGHAYFATAPGFEPALVRQLVLPPDRGGRGVSCLGSDTFGPDATRDTTFGASAAIFEAGGMTIENMTNLEQLHAWGDVIVIAPPLLWNGSGFQTDVLGFIQ